MKYIFIIPLFLFIKSNYSQQIVMNSQYMINSMLINPAMPGTMPYGSFVLGFRKQWVGIREAPISQSMSFQNSISTNIGAGAILYNDVAGPTRRTGIQGALTSQVDVSRNTRLSVGMQGSFSQYLIDVNRLFPKSKNDPTLQAISNSQFVPDISIGAKWYSRDFQVGFAAFNLLETKADMYNSLSIATNTLERAYYLNASAMLVPVQSYPLLIEPSMVLRMMGNAPAQFDINLRAIIDKKMWMAVSYRYKDAMVVFFGMAFSKFSISYSYDFGLSALNKFHTGSHEIVLVLRKKNTKGTAGIYGGTKIRKIDCPAF